MNVKLLELRPYMLKLNNDLYEMFQEIPSIEEYNNINELYGLTKEQTYKKICEFMRKEYCISESNMYNPQINYVFYVDNKPVAYAGLKLKINKYWVVHSGTIWYKTRPSERGKGYGTLLVKHLIERAKELDLTYLYASVSNNNIKSQKILEKNGFSKSTDEFRGYFYKLQLKEEPINQKNRVTRKFGYNNINNRNA